MLSRYKQFNVVYWDFEYNQKRIRVFPRFEEASEFALAIVTERKYRLLSIDPKW